ncbi:hypothetical protein CW304_20355 [Bacillus sp. UFRGS-B20]|nr:hypothetical protein CW304_20355 [Bacillus sp. UFRGS-B20]
MTSNNREAPAAYNFCLHFTCTNATRCFYTNVCLLFYALCISSAVACRQLKSSEVLRISTALLIITARTSFTVI